ncbi:hypothetical protein J6590_005935 [Homalodisca vitripennis]|nr:hypothetical protein J6590_005935 [Homalodisca vitripennis]
MESVLFESKFRTNRAGTTRNVITQRFSTVNLVFLLGTVHGPNYSNGTPQAGTESSRFKGTFRINDVTYRDNITDFTAPRVDWPQIVMTGWDRLAAGNARTNCADG